jgi:hypothetical protein
MAKKLAKAQMGKAIQFLNKAVKSTIKTAQPVVKELSEFQKARLASGKKLGPSLSPTEQKAKRELNESIANRTLKKQQGGPMDGDKSRPSITAKPKQTPKPKKDVLNPNSNRVVPRNYMAPGKPAAPGSAAYPLEHFKPFKPTVAQKGGAVKTKTKKK